MAYRWLVASAVLALVGAPAALARGGGYYVVMIPGMKLTPKKDNICVAETVKVGDAGKNPNGDVITVKAVSGKSPMCKNKATPILAEVEFQASATFQSTLSIELPEGYAQQELTDKQKFDGNRLLAFNRKKNAWIRVQSWDRKGVTYFNRFVSENKHTAAEGPNSPTQTPTDDLTIHGAAAQRYETTTHPKSILAPDQTTQTTMLLGDSELVAVTVWAPAKAFPALREELAGVAESLTGLVKEPTAPPPAPAAAPAGAAPQGP